VSQNRMASIIRTTLVVIGVPAFSFFVTNFVLDRLGRENSDPLISGRVIDDASLASAAKSSALTLARLQGYVDRLQRTGQQVAVSGWSADPTNADGAPLTVIFFVGGKIAFQTETRGQRQDVSNLGLSAMAAKNVMFEGVFICSPGEPIIPVVVSKTKTYAPLSRQSCP
jgi:hypothetical protein